MESSEWRCLPGRKDVLLNVGGRTEWAVSLVDAICLSRW